MKSILIDISLGSLSRGLGRTSLDFRDGLDFCNADFLRIGIVQYHTIYDNIYIYIYIYTYVYIYVINGEYENIYNQKEGVISFANYRMIW